MILKPLTEFCTVNMGQSPDSKTYNDHGNGIPFYQGNADFGEIHPETRVWCSAPVKIAEAGDILISVRAPIGAMNMAVERCCIGRGLAALTPISEKCGKQFLYYALQSKVESLIAQGTGSTFKAISKKVLEATLIPAYSTREQEQITATISHVDRAIAARRDQLVLLDQLVKSRFVELMDSAELSGETTIEQVTERVKVGFVGTCEKYYTDDSGIPMLRTGNITDHGIDMSDLKYITAEFHEKNKKSQIRSGDLLIARHGSNGQANVYDGPEAQCLNAVVIVPNLSIAKSVFLAGLINSPNVKKQIDRTLVGSTQHVVNTKSIANLTVRIPCLEVQEQYEAFVEQTDKSKYYNSLSYHLCRQAASNYRQEWMTCRTSNS